MYRILLSFMLLIASVSFVHAQSNNVKLYCAYDYMRHCSAYSLSSPNLAKCMANVGVNLSKKCIQALVDDGLITKQEVIARAAKEGIVVRDGPDGLFIDTNAKIGQEVVTVDQPKETIVAKEVPVTEKVTTSITTGVEKTKSAVTKAASSVKKSAQKAATAVKTQYKKAATAVKKKYQQVTKSNKEYANLPGIKSQNELRKRYIANRNIASEGWNADFGRYEAREPGFTKSDTYNFKKRMESRDIFSSGVNGY